MFTPDNEKLALDKLNKIVLERNVKWNDIFESEDRLVETLKNSTFPYSYQGGFLHSLQKWVLSDKELTEKQMIQLKRNAGNIYKIYYNQ